MIDRIEHQASSGNVIGQKEKRPRDGSVMVTPDKIVLGSIGSKRELIRERLKLVNIKTGVQMVALLDISRVGALALALTAGVAHAQTPPGDSQRFIGSWRLVETTNDGKIRPERGALPTGIITYHQSGWMAAQIQPDRPPVRMAGQEPTGEEAKAALFGYTAYFGTYTVDEKAKTVIHHRKASVSPGWEQRPDFVRAYEFIGADRVVLRPVGNKNELVWERLK